MSASLAKQQAILHSISRFLEKFKKIGKNNYTAARIRSRISLLKDTWAQCLDEHAVLTQEFSEAKKASIDYFKDNLLDLHEDIYQETLDYMADCLEELEPSVRATSSQGLTNQPCNAMSTFSLSHLPHIKLPPFSGNFEDWENFRDCFTSLIINNKDLSAFARMHFLASSLTGRALDSIKNIAITADNFDIAWNAFMARFDNKRRLIECHVSALANLPNVGRESASELNDLRDKANRAIASLKNLKRSSEDMLSDILAFSVSQKLDPVTRKAWKLKGSEDSNPPTYDDLDRFLASRARALAELAPLNDSKAYRTNKITSATASTAPLAACPLCKASHFINKCPKFVNASPSQRLETINKFKRCINCLSSKHTAQACLSKYSCRTCQKRHHSMLHVDSVSSSNANSIAPAAATGDIASVTTLLSSAKVPSRPQILLATARVKIRSPSGRECVVRALIDQGSEITFITERLRQSLKMRRFKMPISISAVGCADVSICRYAAQIHIVSYDNSHPNLTTTASIMKSLMKYFPSPIHSGVPWEHISGLALADPDPTSSDPIDILIGADLYGELILDGIRRGTRDQPIAQNTIFGWVLSGRTFSSFSPCHNITAQHCSSAVSLDAELRRFWEIEEAPRQTLLSPAEQQCGDHFCTTHSRDRVGRYVVRLPFKQGPPLEIGQSYEHAERLLRGLHRRFKRNRELKTEYVAFIREYEQLGHLTRISPSDISSSQCVYIPHHPVVRESSTTTRLRVVFNASSRTSNGTSLNDHMLTGPKLQTDLAAVILRWRQFRYVYSTDIAKMYRQILVNLRDIDYQRILWSESDTNAIQAYQLLTVTYGTSSAPFLALRVLRQLALDEGHSFPLAGPILQDNIYVDDVLFGANDIPLLRQIRDQLCGLLHRGKFELRKWSSNSENLLGDIAPEDHGLACQKIFQSDEQLKILGISWTPANDAFQFRVSFPALASPTKRSILSTIAKLFDPLGWVTPVTITAKIFLQRLWHFKADWDQIIPSDLARRWENIQASLSDIDSLRLNRWVQRESNTVTCELHGFSDASNAAYAAAVYIRVISFSGEVASSLLISKSKVAPIKSLSIPRLELATAVLLAKLLEFVWSSLHLVNASCYCWTDSTVVLAWVTQHPSKWKTFVSNRVSEIQSRVPFASWRHVPTADNPADCASRGIFGSQLAENQLWWQDPTWLRLCDSEWPSPHPTHSYETAIEQNPRITIHLTHPTERWELESRFSSWTKLLRVTAYALRFITRIRRRAEPYKEFDANPFAVSANEYLHARNFWLRRMQAEAFPAEKDAILQKKSISPRSVLSSLNPFLGEDELIRGRLANAPLSLPAKHPIILSSSSQPSSLLRLIVRHAHLRSLHAGTQLTLTTLRRDYWILRARSIVKAVIHEYVVCTRERAKVPSQLMGNLPHCRVSPSARAFLHCGLDYAGPISIRALSGRGFASRKAYIAVFICMATRAIHLEVVDGYSTSAFLDAFSRFCSRRGFPSEMYSDNGTTFVGADRELRSAFRAALRDPNFFNSTAHDQISWHFLPPSAPHFGGLWEAGVRSIKHHLRRVVGSHTLTFEEFATLLCNVEACLNSRPLAPLTDVIDDYEPLTPGHFLIGSALTAIPESSVLNLKENRLTRWQIVRQLTERFWKLWINDYINTLQQRAKWRKVTDTVRAGQLVLIRNPLLPPCKWELGRIIKCHAGSDDLIRVVTVKTASSEYKRPIVKLCILPIEIDDNASACK